MPRRRRPPRPGALADLSPTRILSQIVLLQLAYYACAAILIVFTALVAGKEISLDLLLSWRSLRGDTTVGWTLGLVWVLNSLIGYAPCACPGRCHSIADVSKCYIHSDSYRALKTRPRLRLNGTFHSPFSHFLLYTCSSCESLLVGATNMQRNIDDVSWGLGMSMAGAKTYQFRQQDEQCATDDGRRGRGRIKRERKWQRQRWCRRI